MKTRAVSNAYWATTFKKAYTTLKHFKDYGLTELNISTGDEHLMWVSFDNIINTIIACIKLDLILAVNVETSPTSIFTDKDIYSDIRLQKYDLTKIYILRGQWMPMKKSTSDIFDQTTIESAPIPNMRCKSLFDTITIHPNHEVYACCGLASTFLPFLRLGNAKNIKLKRLYSYQFEDFMKIWLFTEGPLKIKNFCIQNGGIFDENQKPRHICQICVQTLSKHQNLNIIKNNYKSILGGVMMQYFLLKKQYE